MSTSRKGVSWKLGAPPSCVYRCASGVNVKRARVWFDRVLVFAKKRREPTYLKRTLMQAFPTLKLIFAHDTRTGETRLTRS